MTLQHYQLYKTLFSCVMQGKEKPRVEKYLSITYYFKTLETWLFCVIYNQAESLASQWKYSSLANIGLVKWKHNINYYYKTAQFVIYKVQLIERTPVALNLKLSGLRLTMSFWILSLLYFLICKLNVPFSNSQVVK